MAADEPATGGLRIYADTSVFGGVFDEEFARPSRAFFEQVERGRFTLVTSPLVLRELQQAPSPVQTLFRGLLPLAEIADVTDEVQRLQSAYIAASIVAPKWELDALHVALATVARCAIIVSWNFKHIVHFEKIAGYNTVNTRYGYSTLAIHSPHEVIAYEDEDV